MCKFISISNIFTVTSVALMVNNLGGTSVLELNIVAKEAIQWLGKMHEYIICHLDSNIGKNSDLIHCYQL